MASILKDEHIQIIINHALKAGKIASDAFTTKDFSTTRKSDGSKVTSADVAISEFLRNVLVKDFPDIPIICEEGELRDIKKERFFLIDPIDGTSSFASGSDQFALNIALIDNKKAIFGLIYAPLFEGGKMVFTNAASQVIIRSQDKQQVVEKRDIQSIDHLRIITSARTKAEDITSYIQACHPQYQDNVSVQRLSSAIKFIRLIEDQTSIYLHLRPSMEWDTAAGQALVEVMSGKVKKIDFNQGKFLLGDSLDYQKADFANQSFIAFINEISGGA